VDGVKRIPPELQPIIVAGDVTWLVDLLAGNLAKRSSKSLAVYREHVKDTVGAPNE
jgi:hypothetical protein